MTLFSDQIQPFGQRGFYTLCRMLHAADQSLLPRKEYNAREPIPHRSIGRQNKEIRLLLKVANHFYDEERSDALDILADAYISAIKSPTSRVSWQSSTIEKFYDEVEEHQRVHGRPYRLKDLSTKARGVLGAPLAIDY